MRKSLTGHLAGRQQKPWVHRIGQPFSPISMMLIVTLASMVGLMVLTSSACTTQSAVSTKTDNFNVGDSLTLNVTTLGGQIEVSAGSDNVVTVRAELRDIRRIKYLAIQSGNEVTITAEKTGKWWFPAGNTRVDIYVTVPPHTALKLSTSNSKIEVQGTTAGGILETSNEAIVLNGVKGDYVATTSNSDVAIYTMEGSAYVKTSNGELFIDEAKGEFNATTSGGNVSFSGQMTPGGSNRLVTSNGCIDVELAGTPSVHLDASTTNAKVECALPILATKTDTDHLVGTIGAGEADLYIETYNGNVTIK